MVAIRFIGLYICLNTENKTKGIKSKNKSNVEAERKFWTICRVQSKINITIPEILIKCRERGVIIFIPCFIYLLAQ